MFACMCLRSACDVCWFTLTSTVANTARPLNSSARRLYTGLIIWHGPQDTLKKSTMTGRPVLSLLCLSILLKSPCVPTSRMLRAGAGNVSGVTDAEASARAERSAALPAPEHPGGALSGVAGPGAPAPSSACGWEGKSAGVHACVPAAAGGDTVERERDQQYHERERAGDHLGPRNGCGLHGADVWWQSLGRCRPEAGLKAGLQLRPYRRTINQRSNLQISRSRTHLLQGMCNYYRRETCGGRASAGVGGWAAATYCNTRRSHFL